MGKTILAINGSPRKDGNCAALLQSAADGALSAGAEVELLHLGDHDYRGCISCFRCRRKPEPCVGCGLDDGLQPVLRACYRAGGILLATPVYFANYPAGVRGFMERLLYHYPHREGASTYKPVRLLYAMNATQQQAEQLHYHTVMEANEDFFRRNFQDVASLWAYNTYQFSDYDKYVHANDMASKERSRAEDFPRSLEQAYAMGRQMAQILMGED